MYQGINFVASKYSVCVRQNMNCIAVMCVNKCRLTYSVWKTAKTYGDHYLGQKYFSYI